MLITWTMLICLFLKDIYGQVQPDDVEPDERFCSSKMVTGSLNDDTVCVTFHQAALPRRDALRECRRQNAFLLKLDADLEIGDLPLGDYLLQKNFPKVWTGVHRIDGRLKWDELVQRYVLPNSISSQQTFTWDFTDPSGGCGQLNSKYVTQPSFEGQSPSPVQDGSYIEQTIKLVSCSTASPFVCYREPINPRVDQVSWCSGSGWVGNINSDKCYYLERTKRLPQKASIAQCRKLRGTLVDPKDDLENKLVISIVKQYDEGDIWMRSSGKTCQMIKDGRTRVRSRCNQRLLYMCQKPVKNIGTPIIVQPNRDHPMLMSSNQLGRSINCEIKNRLPNMPVTWFKDGHVVYSAPDDSQNQIGLRIDQSLLSKLPVVPGLPASVGDLQGLYWCETWSLKPFRRVTSPTIMLRLTDSIRYVATVDTRRIRRLEMLDFILFRKWIPSFLQSQGYFTSLANSAATIIARDSEVAGLRAFITDFDNIEPSFLSFAVDVTLSGPPRLDKEKSLQKILEEVFRRAIRVSNVTSAPLLIDSADDVAESLEVYSTVACYEDSVLQPDTNIPTNFNRTNIGDVAVILQDCNEGPVTRATRECSGDFFTGAYWEDVEWKKGCSHPPIKWTTPVKTTSQQQVFTTKRTKTPRKSTRTYTKTTRLTTFPTNGVTSQKSSRRTTVATSKKTTSATKHSTTQSPSTTVKPTDKEDDETGNTEKPSGDAPTSKEVPDIDEEMPATESPNVNESSNTMKLILKETSSEISTEIETENDLNLAPETAPLPEVQNTTVSSPRENEVIPTEDASSESSEESDSTIDDKYITGSPNVTLTDSSDESTEIVSKSEESESEDSEQNVSYASKENVTDVSTENVNDMSQENVSDVSQENVTDVSKENVSDLSDQNVSDEMSETRQTMDPVTITASGVSTSLEQAVTTESTDSMDHSMSVDDSFGVDSAETTTADDVTVSKESNTAETNDYTEEDASDGTKEDDASDGTKEDDASDGTKEDDAFYGTKEDDASDGTTEDDASDDTKEDDASDGTKEDDASDGTKEDDAFDGTKEDDASDGTKEDDASDGTNEDDASAESSFIEYDDYEDRIDDLMEDIIQETKVADDIDEDVIIRVVDMMREIITSQNNVSKEMGEKILTAVDKVLSARDDEIEDAQEETAASNRLIQTLEAYSDKADLNGGSHMRIVRPNVAMEIWDLDAGDEEMTLGLTSFVDPEVSNHLTDESVTTIFDASRVSLSEVDVAIIIPPSVMRSSLKGKNGKSKVRLTLFIYQDVSLFNITSGKRLNSRVISASINGEKITGLTEKIKTVFRPIQPLDSNSELGESVCGFWDFQMNNYHGGWSTRGCVHNGTIGQREICLCDHLTNFAILIDFYGQEKPIARHHEEALSIISIIGLSLSIMGLVLTILSFIMIRKLRKGKGQLTLLNLVIALLCSWVIFLAGIDQTQNYAGCIAVAALLHYFILSSFMWMLMQAVLQYLRFVKVLGTYVHKYMWKTAIPAWVIPLVPVVILLSIDYTLYKGGDNKCWMTLTAFYYTFAIPIAVIIIVNLVVFVLIIISITNRPGVLRSNQSKQKMRLMNLQAAMSCFILLGLTWIFGYLSISDGRVVFQYIFTILNSLQGFLIFVVFILRKKPVRDQWLAMCFPGFAKDKKKTGRSTNSYPLSATRSYSSKSTSSLVIRSTSSGSQY